MYINENINEKNVNETIVKKVNQLLKKGYNIQEILNDFARFDLSFFKVVFGKVICSYFEEKHKIFPKEKIKSATEEDIFHLYNLEECFFSQKELMKKFDNDFEKFSQVIYENIKKIEEYPEEVNDIPLHIEDFNFDLYLLHAMYQKENIEKIYKEILNKKSSLSNLNSLWKVFEESLKKLNINKVTDIDMKHIYKEYNPLFAVESLYREYDNLDKVNWDNYLIEKYKNYKKEKNTNINERIAIEFIHIMDYELMEEEQTYYEAFITNYYSYIKGRSICHLPIYKTDFDFLQIVENSENIKNDIKKDLFTLGSFCICYLKHTCNMDFQKHRNVQEIGKQSEEYKVLNKKMQYNKK